MSILEKIDYTMFCPIPAHLDQVWGRGQLTTTNFQENFNALKYLSERLFMEIGDEFMLAGIDARMVRNGSFNQNWCKQLSFHI